MDVSDFTIPLASGDRLLLYTDGVSEAANKQAEGFGYQRIAAAAALAPASAVDYQRWVMEEVMKFCGGEFGDDVTLIAAAVRRHVGVRYGSNSGKFGNRKSCA